MVIYRFSKWLPSAILDFENLQFLSRGLCRHAVLLPGTKFRWYWTIGYGQKKTIFKMAAVAISSFKISIFGHVTVIGFNIWCCVPNVIKIGRFFTEIWQYNDFQNGDRPPSWILKICSFLSCSPCWHAVLLPHTKVCWNRTIGWWVMAKKAIFKMAAAAILNFKNFYFWSRDCHRVQHLMRCTKFHQNRTIFYWDMAI